MLLQQLNPQLGFIRAFIGSVEKSDHLATAGIVALPLGQVVEGIIGGRCCQVGFEELLHFSSGHQEGSVTLIVDHAH